MAARGAGGDRVSVRDAVPRAEARALRGVGAEVRAPEALGGARAQRLARVALGQLREVAVDDAGALPPLVDRPHDEGLAATGVARGEDALGRGRVGAGLGVAALVALDAELLE